MWPPTNTPVHVSDEQDERIQIRVELPIEQLAAHLKYGRKLWGGGCSVTRTSRWLKFFEPKDHAKVLEVTSEYVLRGPTEDGGTYEKIFFNPHDAVWAYLQRIGGSGVICIS